MSVVTANSKVHQDLALKKLESMAMAELFFAFRDLQDEACWAAGLLGCWAAGWVWERLLRLSAAKSRNKAVSSAITAQLHADAS